MLVLAVVLAAGLLGCGGDDDGGGPSTGSPPAGEEVGGTGGDVGESRDPDRGTGEGAGPGEGERERGGAGPTEPSDPPAPGFRDTSGATDIPAYGEEAGGGERAAAARVLNGYLAARRAGDPRRACDFLFSGTRAQLAAAGSQGSGGGGCPEGLRLSERVAPDAYFGNADVAALRRSDAGAFALFHGADGVDYWVALRMEGGQWRVISTIPQPLEPDGGG